MEHHGPLRPGGGPVSRPGALDHTDALGQGGVAQILRGDGGLVRVGAGVDARQLGGGLEPSALRSSFTA